MRSPIALVLPVRHGKALRSACRLLEKCVIVNGIISHSRPIRKIRTAEQDTSVWHYADLVMTLRCIAQRIRSSFVHVELPLVMVHVKGVDRVDEETSSSNRMFALYPLAAVRGVQSHLFVLVLTRGGPITFASGR